MESKNSVEAKAAGPKSRSSYLVPLILSVLLAVNTVVLAQVRTPKSARPAALQGFGLPPFDESESLGVFIGVEKFPEDEAIVDASYAVDDAVDLAHLFAFELKLIPLDRIYLALSGSPEKQVTQSRLEELRRGGAQSVEATRTRLLSLCRTITQGAGPAGLLIVSISSHGFDDDGDHLILASDSLFYELRDTALPVRKFFEAASQAESKRRVLLIDACRTRILRDRRPPATAKVSAGLKDALSKSHGQAILAAARPGEAAYAAGGNGIFVGAVLDGLRCRAPRDSRGFVTVETLSAFVNQAVKEWVRNRSKGEQNGEVGIDRQLGGEVDRLPLVRCEGEAQPSSLPQPLFAENQQKRDFSPASCLELELDLNRGTLSGLRATDSQDQIRQRLPCDPIQIPDNVHDLGELIYPLEGVRFATAERTIEVQSTFSGKVVFRGLPFRIFGRRLAEVVRLLGEPEFEGRNTFFWERAFGCLGLSFQEGRIVRLHLYGSSCSERTGS